VIGKLILAKAELSNSGGYLKEIASYGRGNTAKGQREAEPLPCQGVTGLLLTGMENTGIVLQK
jgi:hypothetical protein